MATFTDMHDDTIESLSNVKLTFVNLGGGDASLLPLKYLASDSRITAAKAIADYLGGKSAYKPQSLVAYVAIDKTTPVPADPGAEPRDVNFHFRVSVTGQPDHKESFFVPGVIVPNAAAIQAMGEGLAAILNANSDATFTFLRITNPKR